MTSFLPMSEKKKMFLDAQKQLTYMTLHVFGTIRKKIQLYFKTDAVISVYNYMFFKVPT